MVFISGRANGYYYIIDASTGRLACDSKDIEDFEMTIDELRYDGHTVEAGDFDGYDTHEEHLF